ncbi:NAD(P)-dependent oxidoreductase [Microlunatus antarcticus]|uniref:3-hydroxyisobutyrate dehydrogenase n=1 Tax=Microlunatus antarcticus TaxID=53388 RepID=A0A7W5JSX2_9ACTN|nr:NAD(P)-dependent oxidoreductase [Microlunatus antarcticus]MBB3325663.1 3-hydroxyisobutyrate dehydrogenase [Microlunatus antarcticus]
MRAAVLGTGVMGAGMVRSLRRADIEVNAWNRTRDKAEPLADDGARVYATAAEAVADADVVLVMLFDTEAVLEVMAEALPATGNGAVWVQCSTIGPEGTERVADLASRFGAPFVDAPVLGTKQPAEQGALVFLASGAKELRERVAPAFEAMGSKTIWVGTEPGRGSALKLVCNAFVGTLTAAVGQSVGLATQLGLDPQLFLDALDGGASDSPYVHLKGAMMLKDAYPASFALDGVRKDLGLIRAVEEQSGTRTTLTEAVVACFDAAAAQGHGADDMAAVVTAFRD